MGNCNNNNTVPTEQKTYTYSQYRIEISGSDRDGNEIYAIYTGKLDYFDDSEGE